MLLTLLVKFLKGKMDAEAAKATPVGSSVVAKGIAHGVKMFGGKWTLDVIARRTE